MTENIFLEKSFVLSEKNVILEHSLKKILKYQKESIDSPLHSIIVSLQKTVSSVTSKNTNNNLQEDKLYFFGDSLNKKIDGLLCFTKNEIAITKNHYNSVNRLNSPIRLNITTDSFDKIKHTASDFTNNHDKYINIFNNLEQDDNIFEKTFKDFGVQTSLQIPKKQTPQPIETVLDYFINCFYEFRFSFSINCDLNNLFTDSIVNF